MKSIDINTSSCSGLTLQFRYNAGSNPGSTRTVVVEEHTSRHIGGYDFLRGKYRKFSVSQMDNVRMLEVKDGAFEVDVDNLPENLTMNYMKNAYHRDGFATYDQGNGILVCVKKELVEPPKPTASLIQGELVICGPGGTASIKGGLSGNVRISVNGTLMHSDANPKQLIDCLQAVVNG